MKTPYSYPTTPTHTAYTQMLTSAVSLATLILLLGVSAAIVLRSLVLRRRHRRMIEEAIANGTWIPPTPTTGAGGRGGRDKVDLTKKPKMYEAYIGGAEGIDGVGWVNVQVRISLLPLLLCHRFLTFS